MTAASCEAKARLWRDFPSSRKAITKARGARPSGFDTRYFIGSDHPKVSLAVDGRTMASKKAVGYLLAFGARLDRCFAFAYTTELDGPGSEREMAERLLFVRRQILKSVRLEQPMDVQRQLR